MKRKPSLRTGIIILGLGIFGCAGVTCLGILLSPSADSQDVNQEDNSTAQPQTTSVESTSTLFPTSVPLPTSTNPPTRTPIPTATRNPNLLDSGTYLVGTDIQPGIYVGYAGNDLLSSCYWERLNSLSGQFDAIIANDNAIGQFYIRVLESDVALNVECEVTYIENIASQPTITTDDLSAGTYLVGIDIRPGTYRGHAGGDLLSSCYWARLNDVTGEFSAIIANDNATGQFYVEISPSDFAFNVACEITRVGD